MTTFDEHPDLKSGRLSLAEILEVVTDGHGLPLKFTAYDGSSTGPDDAEIGLELLTPRGTTYLATAPGDLGMARAYVSGDLETHGVHPGDPYPLLRTMAERLSFKRPSARMLAHIVRSIGAEHLRPIAPPPQDQAPQRVTRQTARHVAAGVWRAQGDDATGALFGEVVEQPGDDQAAHAMAHEVDRLGVEGT